MQSDVLVIGAGPAGISAALAAAEATSVTVVDDNPAPGGQIWRAESNARMAQFASANITRIHGARVFAQPEPGVVLAESGGKAIELRHGTLILATGARERFLPFPGWTLPHVTGAGGLQALVKGGLPIAGKRIVVAGSGPLLLVVAAFLRKHGALVPFIAEQATRAKLASFALAVARQPAKVAQAALLKWQLRGVPYLHSAWPVAATNGAVTINTGRKEPCDYLACGFGLVPNTELASLIGCDIANSFVRVDTYQQTSIANVYCAGEPTGIGGVDAAIIEGQIAGYAATGRAARADVLLSKRDAAKRFELALDRAFTLRPELRELAQADTIVCRCEDVPLSRIASAESWREAKLHTRCGMGPCQGRVCGPAVDFIKGWPPESVRPPAFPVSVATLIGD